MSESMKVPTKNLLFFILVAISLQKCLNQCKQKHLYYEDSSI